MKNFISNYLIFPPPDPNYRNKKEINTIKTPIL